jgi:hypothetical protein
MAKDLCFWYTKTDDPTKKERAITTLLHILEEIIETTDPQYVHTLAKAFIRGCLLAAINTGNKALFDYNIIFTLQSKENDLEGTLKQTGTPPSTNLLAKVDSHHGPSLQYFVAAEWNQERGRLCEIKGTLIRTFGCFLDSKQMEFRRAKCQMYNKDTSHKDFEARQALEKHIKWEWSDPNYGSEILDYAYRIFDDLLLDPPQGGPMERYIDTDGDGLSECMFPCHAYKLCHNAKRNRTWSRPELRAHYKITKSKRGFFYRYHPCYIINK